MKKVVFSILLVLVLALQTSAFAITGIEDKNDNPQPIAPHCILDGKKY